MSAVQALAQSVLDTLAPRPCGGHHLIRSTDMPDGGRLHTCSCGHQARTAVPRATDVEKLALIVIEQDRTLRELQGQVAGRWQVMETPRCHGRPEVIREAMGARVTQSVVGTIIEHAKTCTHPIVGDDALRGFMTTLNYHLQRLDGVLGLEMVYDLPRAYNKELHGMVLSVSEDPRAEFRCTFTNQYRASVEKVTVRV